jgi:Protein-disulfide isomerase
MLKRKLEQTLGSPVTILALMLLLALAAVPRGFAQNSVDSVLRPPKGSQVAIVVFEDLQCPMCRRTAPLVEQASKTYKIPVIRHDFPLPCITGRTRRP